MFEGRLVVLVDISCGSRVISIVVLTESHKGLQIGKKFLGKTVEGCSVFKSLGIGDILVNVNVISVANWRQGVFLHILNLVQAVKDVTTKIVEELVVVSLLEKSHTIVFQPIGSGPVSVRDVVALWSWCRADYRLIFSSSPAARIYGGTLVVWPGMPFLNRW